jgi:salicylate hydroxylase
LKEPEQGAVILTDGTRIAADIIVAAEGIHSKAVKFIVGYENPAVLTGTSCFRFLMPAQDILDDNETKGLMEDHEGLFRFYTDNKGRILVWYPCRG